MRAKRWAALAVTLGACTAAEAPSRFEVVADVQELMVTVLEPAAETYWDAVGTIIDMEGTTEIRPRSDEAWERVRSAAFVLAESGNLLMMEERALDDEAWIAMSQSMIAVGRRAIEAAEAKDPDAVFDVGGDVYAVCSSCHATYATGTLRPSDARTDPPPP